MDVDDHAALLAAWGQSDVPPASQNDTITARRTQAVSRSPFTSQETRGRDDKPKPKPKPRPRTKASNSQDTEPTVEDDSESPPAPGKQVKKKGMITGPAFVSEDEGVERDAAQSSPIKARGTRLTTEVRVRSLILAFHCYSLLGR